MNDAPGRSGGGHPDDADLQDYFDGTLASSRRRDVREHLDGCAACSSVLQELESLRETLRGLPRTAEWTPRGAPERASRVATARRSRGSRLALAASLLVTFGGGMVAGVFAAGGGEGAPPAASVGDAMGLATDVQRTGTAYATAVSALGQLTDASPVAPVALAQGREVALSVLYGATLAYSNLDPADDGARRILRTIQSVHGRIPGSGSRGGETGGS